MRKLIALFFISFSINAQNAQDIIDGLKKELQTNLDPKKTAIIYSDLTWYYSNISLDSATLYGKKALVESVKLKDSTLMAQVYSDIGAVYFRKGDLGKSKINYLNAYKIRNLTNDISGQAKININLASIYTSEQNYKKAVKFNLEALSYFEKEKNEKVVASTKANLGYIFRELKNYPKAIKYLQEAILYQKENNMYDTYCTSCVNIGNAYLEYKDTIKAIEYIKKGIDICKKAGDKNAISSLYNNLATIKIAQNKSTGALSLLNKSAIVRNELNSKLAKASLKLNLVDVYIKEKKFADAQLILLQIKKVFEEKKSNIDLMLTYKRLITVYANLNKPDSVTFYANKYALSRDKTIELSVVKETAELEAKYQNEKKEKQIIKQQAEAKQQNNTIIILSILALGLSFIGLLIYRQQKLKITQQEQEHQLKNAISQIETQNKLQEQRLSISRDLHDNIGAQLTFIISSVDNVKYAFDITNEKLDNKLTTISSFAKETIVELRDTIWAMNHNQISYEDLEIRINNYIEKAKQSKDQISFSFAIDENLKNIKLTSVEGMNIYRTIQEAINNSIKYANASIISINVKKLDSKTKITISDNGIGFNEATIEKGNGLQNMKKRIEEINGSFYLTSSNEGTKIEIQV